MILQRNRAKTTRIGMAQLTKRALLGAAAGLSIAALLAQTALSQNTPEVAQDVEIIESHGYSFFGDLKYPADYTHFDYVNPDAPKGGEVSIAVSGTFDSMNPYTRKARAGALSWSMFTCGPRRGFPTARP